MGLLDIFKTDELKAKIYELERRVESISKEKNELQVALVSQKEEYEQKIKKQEQKHRDTISHYERIILAFEEATNRGSSGEDTEKKNDLIDEFPVDNHRKIDEIFELNNQRQMSQIEDLSNPAPNNFKVKKTSKGMIIEKYIGDEEVVVVPPVIDREIVYKIGDSAFYNCKKTKKVELPNTISEIGKEAFLESGLEQINLPEHLILIDEWAFDGTYLSEVVFPHSLQTIGKYAFSGTDIKELILPENIKDISEGAFANTNLETLVIEGAISIGKRAFFETCLKKIMLPEGLKIIENEAFRCGFRDVEKDGINELVYIRWKKIVIPRSVEKIGTSNFEEGQHIALLNENVEIDYADDWTKKHHDPYRENDNRYATLYCNNGGAAFEKARKLNVTIKPLAEFPNEIIEDSDDEFEKEFDEEDVDEDVDYTDDIDYNDEDDESDKDDASGGNYYGDGELDTSSWNLESILRQEGYTVSQKEDLSDYERQQILLSVMRRNLMSKWQIIEHIELQISLRKNNRIYRVAISKWERDLAFLRRL